MSIGVGRNLEDLGITKDEALYLLDNDLKRCQKKLSQFDWFNELDRVRQEVIIELSFNIGLTSLLKFKKMIAALTIHDYSTATTEMLDSKWRLDVGPNRSNNMASRLLKGRYDD